MEKCDLVEASENVLALIKDYEEVECDWKLWWRTKIKTKIF
jgi:hypothetical protein